MNKHIVRDSLFSILFLLVITILAGCSGGDPVIPGMVTSDGDNTRISSESGNRLLWGLWQFRFDLSNEAVEIIPLRNMEGHVNVVKMLEPAPLVFLDIDDSTLEVDLTENTIDVDVILRHPLPGYPQYTGFDVRGIFITDGSLSGLSIDENLVFPSAEDSRVLNADGYTRWWNPSEFPGSGLFGYNDGLIGKPYWSIGYSSTVNGFKYFADGLGPEDDIMNPIVLQGRGRFSCSSHNRRHYSLQFGPSSWDFMVFNYAVDASWENPDNIPPMSIEDFPTSANSIEPFHIMVAEDKNSLYYNPELIDCPKSGGSVRLQLDVATWQGPGSIDRVLVGSPDLEFDFAEATEIHGHQDFGALISTYTIDIPAGSFETYQPEIIVAATTPYGSYTSGPENLPIPYTGTEDAPIALYHMYYPSVGTNSPPVVGEVLGPDEVTAGIPYEYEVSEYYDCQDLNEDLVFSWEIGDDSPPLYDNGYGHTSGICPYGNGSITITFPDAGDFLVDVRVTDLEGRSGYSSGPLLVNAVLPDPPVFPTESVNLELSLNRNIYNSYEYVINPSDTPSIDLEWDGSVVSGAIQEWAVYRDDDPYDETEVWFEVGTTGTTDYTFSNMLTGTNSYNSGGAYYYMVKARAIAGNPGSESVDSTEWAFIELENAEPGGASEDLWPWSMGYGAYEPAYSRQWERPGYGGAIAGGCWMMDPESDYMRRHIWSVIASPELPILTDPVLAATTETWYIELIFGGQVLPMNECWDNYARLSVGTVPDDPSTHTGSTYYGYDEAKPWNHMDGTPYYTSGYWSSNNSRFDQSPSTYNDRYGWGRNEYGWPFNWARFSLVDLNPAGTGRTRAAIGFGTGTTTDYHARPRADEIAVIIW